MIVDKFSRFFLKHEIEFRPHYGHGEPLEFISEGDVIDVATILTNSLGTEKSKLVLRNNDVFRLTTFEVYEKENIAALIFRRSDPDATTQMYEHVDTQKLKKANRTVKDAVAVSAHLFISLERLPGGLPKYSAILEEVPGISKTYIHALFQDLLKEHEYEYETEQGDIKQTHTLMSMDGLKAETIGSAADVSTIQHVELVRSPEIDGLDLIGMIPQQQRMKLKIKPDVVDKIGIVQRIRDWADIKIIIATEAMLGEHPIIGQKSEQNKLFC